MSDKIYSSIEISKIEPNKALPSDIYLKIAEKFIKYLHIDDSISSEKYDLFISKNLVEIYVLEEDYELFTLWVEEERKASIDEIVQEVGEENRMAVEARAEMAEQVFQVFSEEELNPKTAIVLQDQVSEFISRVSNKEIPAQVLASLNKQNQTLAEHSVNVANISVYIALALGNAHQLVLENIYLGALFHDFSKSKIPSKVLENKKSAAYEKAFYEHPKKGASLIKAIPNIPEQVITIISQHHEQFDGKGFPKGLENKEIYELAQIVSISNVFDNICRENVQRAKKEMYKKALKILEYDRGKQFCPDFIKPVIEVLSLAYQ